MGLPDGNYSMDKAEEYKNLWVEKYRPESLDDLVLDDDLRTAIEGYVKNEEIPHLLFYGDAGGGKTTLARIIVNDLLDCQYLYINGSEESGVDVVRGKIKDFAECKSIDGKIKVVILDECEGLSSNGGSGSSAQQALRNLMEEYAHNVRFILTSNYFNKIIDPIVSRCISYHVIPPLKEFILRCVTVLDAEKVTHDKSKIIEYTRRFYPDVRKAINAMQRDTKDGVLLVDSVGRDRGAIIKDIVDHISAKKTTFKLRKMIIDRASEFSNDYRKLMEDLFNYVFESDLSEDMKRKYMLALSNGLYRHELVMDKEINAYSTLLNVY